MLSITPINFAQKANSKSVTNYQQNPSIKLHSQPKQDEVSFTGIQAGRIITSFPKEYRGTLELVRQVVTELLIPKQQNLDMIHTSILKSISGKDGLAFESIPEFKAVLTEPLAGGKRMFLKRTNIPGDLQLSIRDMTNHKYIETYLLSQKGLGLNITNRNSNLPHDAFNKAEDVEKTFENATKKANECLQMFLDKEQERIRENAKALEGMLEFIRLLHNVTGHR